MSPQQFTVAEGFKKNPPPSLLDSPATVKKTRRPSAAAGINHLGGGHARGRLVRSPTLKTLTIPEKEVML